MVFSHALHPVLCLAAWMYLRENQGAWERRWISSRYSIPSSRLAAKCEYTITMNLTVLIALHPLICLVAYWHLLNKCYPGSPIRRGTSNYCCIISTENLNSEPGSEFWLRRSGWCGCFGRKDSNIAAWVWDAAFAILWISVLLSSTWHHEDIGGENRWLITGWQGQFCQPARYHLSGTSRG